RAVAVDQPIACRRFRRVDAAWILSDGFELLLVLAQIFPRGFGFIDVSIGVDDRHSTPPLLSAVSEILITNGAGRAKEFPHPRPLSHSGRGDGFGTPDYHEGHGVP